MISLRDSTNTTKLGAEEEANNNHSIVSISVVCFSVVLIAFYEH